MPHRHQPSPPATRRLITAPMVVDARRVCAAPGAVLLEGPTVLAADSPQAIGAVPDAVLEPYPDAVIIPALANAHTHLDLTHLGPLPFTGDFISWAEMIRTRRAVDDHDIAASVRQGIDLARAGGTALLGDIAGNGSTIPIRELRAARMPGVSFLELFGHGRRQPRAIGRMNDAIAAIPHDDGRVRLGLQPHAPYSCGPDLYRAAADTGLPLATHLAETLEELQFTQYATGPLADMLRRIGVWDDSIIPLNRHPLDAIADLSGPTTILAAHLNYLDPHHIRLLADSRISVAYCPRAGAYFGHPHRNHPPHQYRAMLDAGVNVALGTDSILCLDTPDRISVLDDMRFLLRRDGTDPRTLLAMATTNAAAALGSDPDLFTLAPGPVAALLALPIDAPSHTASELFARALLHPDSPHPRFILPPP